MSLIFINKYLMMLFLACFFPFGAWLFRLLDHFSLLLSFICSTSIVLTLYISFLTIQQMYMINNGQTWHEYGKNIRIYGSEKNFQVVFGKRWHLILFSPLVSSLPFGDGMSFETRMMETSDTHRFGMKQS